MSQEPKKRHSRARQGKRRAALSLTLPTTVICGNCGSTALAHTVCASCGYYKGQQIVQVDSVTVRKNENPK
jgi:large subunit ribosomal protein L32